MLSGWKKDILGTQYDLHGRSIGLGLCAMAEAINNLAVAIIVHQSRLEKDRNVENDLLSRLGFSEKDSKKTI